MGIRLEGKVALVTGGGTGIGAAIARRFARSGARVAVIGRRPAPLEEIAGQIDGLAVVADVTDAAAMAGAVEQIAAAFGGLDIVVANAGVISEGDVAGLTDAHWRQALAINVTGVMETVRAALPHLMRRGGGSIVSISSVAGLMGCPQSAAYCTSKAALAGFTRSLAVDYGPRGIRANTLCPGWVRTPMSDEEMAALAEEKGITAEEAARSVTRYLPLARMADPDEIAGCAEFLASEDASFVTGTILTADGGGCIVDVGMLAFS